MTAGVTVAASVANLVFVLFPDLKPTDPALVDVRMKVRTANLRVPARDYAAGPGGPDTCYREPIDRPESPTLGHVVYLQAVLEGLEDKELFVRCAVYGARTKQEIRESSPEFKPPDSGALSWKPNSGTDRELAKVWISVPTRADQRYFARFEIYERESNGDFTLLDFADSARLPAVVPEKGQSGRVTPRVRKRAAAQTPG